MRLLRVLLSVISIFFVTTVYAAETDENHSRIRFAHFSADVSAVNVLLSDGTPLFTNQQFGDVSEWVQLEYGLHTVVTVQSGGSTESPLVEPLMFALNADDWITITLNGLASTDSLVLHTLNENYSELPAGETRLSFFHAAVGVPALDLTANGNTLFQLVSYPDTISNQLLNDGFVTVDIIANTYLLQLVESVSNALLLDLGEVELLPDRHYFVSIIGTADNFAIIQVSTPLDAIGSVVIDETSVDSPAVGYVRIVHLASGSPDVDLYIDGRLSQFRQVAFTRVTDFVQLPAGTYAIEPVPTGGTISERLTPPETFDISENEYISIAAIGTTENDTFALQVLEENFTALEVGLARISVIHALPGEGAVNVQLRDGTLLLSLLGYPGSQGDNDGIAYVDLLSDTYDLRIVASDDPERVIVDFGEIRLSAGVHYFIALINANPPFVFNYVEMNEE